MVFLENNPTLNDLGWSLLERITLYYRRKEIEFSLKLSMPLKGAVLRKSLKTIKIVPQLRAVFRSRHETIKIVPSRTRSLPQETRDLKDPGGFEGTSPRSLILAGPCSNVSSFPRLSVKTGWVSGWVAEIYKKLNLPHKKQSLSDAWALQMQSLRQI